MIDFTTVSREFRSIVSRRRELLTFLGSVFAAMGIALQNMLGGNLPAALKGLEAHAFASYALLVMAPSLIVALRIARLHAGMTLHAMLYARLMQFQDFTRKGDPQRAARHNFFGVSFLTFLLVDLIAGFSAALLALAVDVPPLGCLAIGIGVSLIWLLLYFRFHHQAVVFAREKIEAESCAPFDKNEWQAHAAGSLEDANRDMLAIIAFVGLMVFSVFEGVSGLGQIKAEQLDIASRDVQRHGPIAYGILMMLTCLMGLVTYVRLRLAIGHRSLEIDPTDQPFKPLRLTDSLLGYMLLAFLFTVSLHVLLFPLLSDRLPFLLLIDALAFIVAIAAEQLSLLVAGRRRLLSGPQPAQRL